MAKFNSLIHNGPIFPEEYQPVGYQLKNTKLSALAEEMLMAYSKLYDSDYLKDKIFVKNFYSSLKEELTSEQKKLKFPIDFQETISQMYNDFQLKKEEKKELPKEIKLAEKSKKDSLKEQYGFALLDGQRQPLGGYLIEPPGLFMGRGESPLRGCWKYRVKPEAIVINFVDPTGKEVVPQAPKGHHWKEVIHNNEVFSSIFFDVDVGHRHVFTKTFRFAAVSDVNKNQDQLKFEKAKKLVKIWDQVEEYINQGLKSQDRKTKECALVSWLILKTSIRVGNEKSEDMENGVVGASTLKQKNIKLIVN